MAKRWVMATPELRSNWFGLVLSTLMTVVALQAVTQDLGARWRSMPVIVFLPLVAIGVVYFGCCLVQHYRHRGAGSSRHNDVDLR